MSTSTIQDILDAWDEPSAALIYAQPDRPGFPGGIRKFSLAAEDDPWIGREIARTGLHLRWEHPGSGASGRHAQLIRAHNSWKLLDRSHNGTLITPAGGETKRIQDDLHELAHGDRIQIGETELWFAGRDEPYRRTGRLVTADMDSVREDDLMLLGSLTDDDCQVVQSAWEAARRLHRTPTWQDVRETYHQRVGVDIKRMDARLSKIYPMFGLLRDPSNREKLVARWDGVRARHPEIVAARLTPAFKR